MIPLRFPGQLYDSHIQLSYNYYRDYALNLGRYVQSDPIGLKGGLNTFAYVGSNPLGYTDRYGSINRQIVEGFLKRQLEIIYSSLADYKENKISLSQLISRLDAVGRVIGGDFWEDKIFPVVLDLELVNSELLDKKRSETSREKEVISTAIRNLEDAIAES